KRSSPNVFEIAATETITSIILIKLIRVSLGTVRHPRRFKIVVIDIQITLKQMLRDFIGIRVNRRSEERFSRNAETDLVCRLLLEKKKWVISMRMLLSTLSCMTLFVSLAVSFVL